MKTLTGMKKTCYSKRFSLFIAAVCLAIGFSSCGNDDSEVPVFSVNDVNGSYTGKMQTLSQPQNRSTGKPVQGVDITAKVKENNIVFNKFPVDDLIKSIVGDVAATPIIAAIGDVKYQVVFQASFKDNSNEVILLKLDPKPLELEFQLSAQKEGESPTPIKVKAIITAEQQGTFTYASHKLIFSLNVTEVYLGEEKFDAFKPTTFKFDLNKQ